MEAYTRKYTYDKLGNIEKLQQVGTNAFTRNFNYPTSGGIKNNNELSSVSIGLNSYNYSYDAVGNQLTKNIERKFEWDAGNQLLVFRNQVGTSEPSVLAQYLYDAGGTRVKKIVRKQGGDYEIRNYIDGVFEYFTDEVDSQNTVHIMDDRSRIASVRIGDAMGDTTPAIKFNIENNIGSSMVLLDDEGAVINQQEYYPFGETSFGSYGKKRYQYVGKERDEESGMYYYGARYYCPWIIRFISVDPLASDFNYLTPYNYAGNRPISSFDIEGLQGSQNESDSSPTPQNNQEINYKNFTINIHTGATESSVTVHLPEFNVEAEQEVGNLGYSESANESTGETSFLEDWNKAVGDFNADFKKSFNQFIDKPIDAIGNFSEGTMQFLVDVTGISNLTNRENKTATAIEQTIIQIQKLPSQNRVEQIRAGLEIGTAVGTALVTKKIVGSLGKAPRPVNVDKTGGTLGNTATRSQTGNIATTLESRGYTITGGGGRTAEEFLKPLGGGRKGGSFLDITATHPNYSTLRINTVDVYKSGLPTLRELNNAARIRTQIAPGEHLMLIPKN
ncbi:MAG: RHS repeat-associated core domain-containing protein [Bacteroidetes bacterium]|nr:RHS repeat-associated core domain-containing protein [Bacteroidota bacterium]